MHINLHTLFLYYEFRVEQYHETYEETKFIY